MAVFVEWLRATGRRPDASPDDVRLWRQTSPDAFPSTIAEFLCTGRAERDLLTALAEHLLVAEMRPDDIVEWSGDPGAAWPRAARMLGATVARHAAPPITPDGADPDGSEKPPRSLP